MKYEHTSYQVAKNTTKIKLWEDTLSHVKDLEGEIKVFDGRCKANYDNILTKTEKTQEEVEFVKHECLMFDKKVELMISQHDDAQASALGIKTEIYQHINDKQVEQMKREETIKGLISKLEQSKVEHGYKLENNRSGIDQIAADLSVALRQYEELRFETDEIKSVKMNHADFVRMRDYFMEDVNNLKLRIEETAVNLRDTDSYIRTYKPLSEFQQIVSTLDNVISDKKERERLSAHVKKIKESLVENIEMHQLLWPNFNKKEIVDIEMPKVDPDWVKKLEKERRGRNNLQTNLTRVSISSQVSQVSKDEKYVDK